MGWIRCVRCEKFRCDFVARTFALIAQFNPFCTKLRAVTKQSKMHPNTTKRTNTWVYGSMGWIRCVRCKKIRCDFMAQTCALIAPVPPVLYQVSCWNEILPNAPKHYETHQNMSLWSNGMDRVCSVRKIAMRFNGTNLCINCTGSTHFAPSFV